MAGVDTRAGEGPPARPAPAAGPLVLAVLLSKGGRVGPPAEEVPLRGRVLPGVAPGVGVFALLLDAPPVAGRVRAAGVVLLCVPVVRPAPAVRAAGVGVGRARCPLLVAVVLLLTGLFGAVEGLRAAPAVLVRDPALDRNGRPVMLVRVEGWGVGLEVVLLPPTDAVMLVLREWLPPDKMG